MARLDRWRRIYEVDDNHPAVRTGVVRGALPSDLRQEFSRVMRMTIAEWFSGSFAVVARQFSWVASRQNPRGPIADLETLRNTCFTEPLHPNFTRAFATHLSTDLATLGVDVIKETKRELGSYSGLGSTVRHEALATRHRPVIRLSDGGLLPLSIDLVVERVAALPRSIAESSPQFGGVRGVGGLLGYMFQAPVEDLLDELGSHHTFLDERALAAALGRKKPLGDGLLVYGFDQLVVEASLQTPHPGVALGAEAAIEIACRRYHGKARQAEGSLNRLGEVVAHIGLPFPTRATYLVVTDDPLRYTPALAMVLAEEDAARQPRFICGFDELEYLVSLGKRAASVPDLVLAWQGGPSDLPLRNWVEETMGHWIGHPDPWERVDLQQWLDDAPRETPLAPHTKTEVA